MHVQRGLRMQPPEAATWSSTHNYDKVVKLDVDANHDTAMRFDVRSIPSILFFKDGQHVDAVVGAVPKRHLVEKVEQHLG